MEKNALNLFCVICQENFSIKPIAYTCGHNFCINCSPFILYNMIDTEEISTEFFNKLLWTAIFFPRDDKTVLDSSNNCIRYLGQEDWGDRN